MKCTMCKNCIGYQDGYYICMIADIPEWIEQCIGNDDNQPCDLYVSDMDDDN